MNKNDKILINVTETADLLGVSRPTVYTLMRRAGFPVVHIGTRTLVHREKLEAWAAALAEEKGKACTNETVRDQPSN